MEEVKKSIRIGGVPSRKQSEFFASTARVTAYGGARGGGKSWALRRKLIAFCLRYPGAKCLLIRRSFAELRQNHLSAFLAEYGSILTYRESEKTLFLPNGSRILFGYCGCDRDVLRYQGQEYDIVAIDEATQLSEYQFSIFFGCLRGVNPCPKRMYLTCNPGGIGHAWVKRLFLDRNFRTGERPEDYRFIAARVEDNEALMKTDPDYKKRLEALPPRLRDAWLLGKWDVFEGQFFPEFDPAVHVLEEAAVPNFTHTFVAMDYGFDMLAALLLADIDGCVYVLDEIAEPGLTLSEAAARVAEGFSFFRPEYAVASPDLWNRRQDSGKSGFEVMSAVKGMPPLIAADDRRIPGWRVVREYLKPPAGGAVRLRITKRCGVLIHSLSSLLCDKSRPEDAAGEPHSVTHAPEALRYGLMQRAPFESKQEEEFPGESFFKKKPIEDIW